MKGESLKVRNLSLQIKNFNFLLLTLLTLTFNFLFLTLLHAKPYHTITVDGNLSDFTDDEKIVSDSNDSTYSQPGSNEIDALYLTWDAYNIYIGISGKVTDNGWLLYVDVNPGSDKGYTDLSGITTWPRKTKFYVSPKFGCDFFYGSWSGADGNFYRLDSATTVTDISGQLTLKTSKTLSKPGSEIRIPFEAIYERGSGKVPFEAKLALVASITTGDSPGILTYDSAPNNISKVLTSSEIDNDYIASLDTDNNGLPDDLTGGVRFSICDISVSNNPFSPNADGICDTTTLKFSVNKPTNLSVDVYDTLGNHKIKIYEGSASFSGTSYPVSIVWDGKDSFGKYVPIGIYILNIKAYTGSEGAKKNVGVVVVR